MKRVPAVMIEKGSLRTLSLEIGDASHRMHGGVWLLADMLGDDHVIPASVTSLRLRITGGRYDTNQLSLVNLPGGLTTRLESLELICSPRRSDGCFRAVSEMLGCASPPRSLRRLKISVDSYESRITAAAMRMLLMPPQALMQPNLQALTRLELGCKTWLHIGGVAWPPNLDELSLTCGERIGGGAYMPAAGWPRRVLLDAPQIDKEVFESMSSIMDLEVRSADLRAIMGLQWWDESLHEFQEFDEDDVIPAPPVFGGLSGLALIDCWLSPAALRETLRILPSDARLHLEAAAVCKVVGPSVDVQMAEDFEALLDKKARCRITRSPGEDGFFVSIRDLSWDAPDDLCQALRLLMPMLMMRERCDDSIAFSKQTIHASEYDASHDTQAVWK